MKASIKFVGIFLVSVVLGLSGCAFLTGYREKPKVSLANISVKNANLTGATIIVVLDVENPNSVAIAVEEIAYKVYVTDKLITTAKTEKPVKIPAKSTEQIEIPLPVKYSQIFGNISEALSAGSLKYKVEGDVKLSFISIPFNKEGLIELPNLL